MHNNLDKFVKEKFQEREFEFNEAHWQGAVNLIEHNEKWKFWKSFGWAAFGVALFFAGGIGGYWLSTSNQTDTTELNTNNAIVQNNTLTEQQQNNQMATLDLSETQETTSNNSIAEATILNSTQVQKSNNTITSSTNTNNAETTLSNNKATNISNINQQSNLSVTSATKTNSTSISLPSTLNNANSGASNATTSAMVAEPSISESTTKAISKIETSKEEAILKPVQKNALPLLAQSIEMWTLSPLAGEEVALSIQESNTTHPIIDKRPKKFFAGLTAGATHYISSGNFTGGMAGLTFKYKLKSQLSLNADLVYHYRPGDYTPTSVVSNVNYGFGRSGEVRELQANNLHYLELPIYAQYQINKHHLEAGVAPSYLLGAKGEINQYMDLDNPTLAAPQPVTLSEGWLEDESFKQWNANLMLGYQYGLTDRFTLGLRANYTLGGITNNIKLDNINSVKQPKLYFNLSAKWFMF